MGAVTVFTPKEIKDLEQQVIQECNLSEEILMEGAAYASMDIIRKKYRGFKVVVICGTGNNGGDGYALARLLYSDGFETEILNIHTHPKHGAAQLNYLRTEHITKTSWEDLELTNKTLVVDAIFGTGLNRSLDRETIEFVKYLNRQDSPILSLDMPTGVNGATGEIMGEAIIANDTISFIGYKRGHFLFPGADCCGNLHNATISVPPNYLSDGDTSINTPINYPILPVDRNKFSGGRVLTIAGSGNYSGAAYLCSRSTLTTTCSYSTLLSEQSVLDRCAILSPELILRSDSTLESCLTSAETIVIGPGLGRDERSEILFMKTMNSFNGPVVIDADALYHLHKHPNIVDKHTGERVLTPHSGELARLLNISSKEVEKDRFKWVIKAAKEYNSIVVLKGHYTLIATPKGKIYINTNSSPSLAAAGSGDILAGLIGGYIHLIGVLSATRLAVYIHNLTGLRLEKQQESSTTTATDILKLLPNVINEYSKVQ